MKRNVFFRVDGGLQIGLGHLIRCKALASMLKDDFQIHFFCASIPKEIESDFIASNFQITHISEEIEFINALTTNEIVVMDNYYFDSEYQKIVHSKSANLIFIDDLMDKEFYADWIINISPSVTQKKYIAQPYTKYAFGLEYSLLRNSFLRFAKHKNTPENNNVFISLGGSDQYNKTLDTLKILKNYDGIINVVVGPSYIHIDELKKYISDTALTNKVNLYQNLNDVDLCKVMRESRLAVCSASTVSIEYLSVTHGLLFLVLTADNQREWYNYALTSNLAYAFTENIFFNNKNYQPDYALQDNLIDGSQKERYLEIFHAI